MIQALCLAALALLGVLYFLTRLLGILIALLLAIGFTAAFVFEHQLLVQAPLLLVAALLAVQRARQVRAERAAVATIFGEETPR